MPAQVHVLLLFSSQDSRFRMLADCGRHATTDHAMRQTVWELVCQFEELFRVRNTFERLTAEPDTLPPRPGYAETKRQGTEERFPVFRRLRKPPPWGTLKHFPIREKCQGLKTSRCARFSIFEESVLSVVGKGVDLGGSKHWWRGGRWRGFRGIKAVQHRVE